MNTCYSACGGGEDAVQKRTLATPCHDKARGTRSTRAVCAPQNRTELLRAHLFRSVVKDVALVKVSSTTSLDKNAATLRGPVCWPRVQFAEFIFPEFSCFRINVLFSAHHSPSRDVQPNQLRLSARHDGDDAPSSFGVEYDASGHLRLDGHVAIDAECRISQVNRIAADTQAHILGELVDSRTQHDSRGRRIVERSNEFT